MTDAVIVQNLRHRYGERTALDGIDLCIKRGEIFGILGPNGSGKSTLFRILSTLVPPQQGQVQILGLPLGESSMMQIRNKLGVVFQSPALDKVLSARENLRHQGHLYGISGRDLGARIERSLGAVGMLDEAGKRTSQLSGGQRRRVELAKALLHDPELLILDEPSTGLDPAVRLNFWSQLRALQDRGKTIALTTHLLDEAERCSRLAILDRGRVIACDTPTALRRMVGQTVLTIRADDSDAAAAQIREKLAVAATTRGQEVLVQHDHVSDLVPAVFELLSGQIRELSVHQPTLEDVFLRLTGRHFDR